MIYVFLAEGFEEIEALTVVDILRRAKLDCKTVGVSGKTVTGSHGIIVICDEADNDIEIDKNVDAIVLPGGMPGTLNLENSPVVSKHIDDALKSGIYIAAICAAPSILGHKGILSGKKATCFPGYEKDLINARVSNESVCVDGKIITAKGAGVSIDFALAIVSELISDERARNLRASLQCKDMI